MLCLPNAIYINYFLTQKCKTKIKSKVPLAYFHKLPVYTASFIKSNAKRLRFSNYTIRID